VIILLPAWPEYLGPIYLSNSKPRFVYTDKHFKPSIEEIKKNINEKTKVLVINSPNNPTGVVYEESFLEEITEIALEHELLNEDEAIEVLKT